MLTDAKIVSVIVTRKLEERPDEPQLYLYLGSALAYLGRGEEAVSLGRRGLELSRNPRTGEPWLYLQLQLVRIHIILGELDPALDQLDPLLDLPFYLSPAWLRIDPLFDPLRDHPRFQALLEKYDAD